ncbi:ATP-binding protein [Treponema putidum]|uniref:Magnesium chelatase n=1 Tax=Treponema putidum TaxID=221027 RepID=A0AAE9MTB8_9SPIR|nr:AAA family ATPase [Treponema putidum]AIN93824.1 magnesium chelatase [Treponema putidum]TWI78198.1 protoporphyrin IX magnesium-chelatase [Treponema putidum]UTY27768.1 magnesium chelatase [Treponema putidum]UTY30229.1 magnesium chelatase [Treponema putidum]UTY32683.1 magnesium chelatase [Treponema putidum]
MTEKKIFPFVQIEGQEDIKLAIILNLICPEISGVLIRGEKGTGKSTIVRGIGDLMQRHGESLKVVELPINATEDRVAGSIDIERVLKTGEKVLQKGILAEADGNILYADEINLLEDYIVDLLLDAAAMGVNTIERDGISYSHSSKFILIGTMNPEEGELRPQLLDRFGLLVDVKSEKDGALRKEIIKKRLAFETDPVEFINSSYQEEKKLVSKIKEAQKHFPYIKVRDEILNLVVSLSIGLNVDGHRGDLTLVRAAKAYAAFRERDEVTKDDIIRLAQMVYSHRLRKKPFEEINPLNRSDIENILNERL